MVNSPHLDFGPASWHPGDVAHDIFGSHGLPGTTLSTEKNNEKTELMSFSKRVDGGNVDALCQMLLNRR